MYDSEKVDAVKIRHLIDTLNHHSTLYNQGEPEISDEEWDTIYFELKKLEEKTNLIYPDSPTQAIHYDKVDSLQKVKHNHLMLSLDKTKDISEIEDFFRGHNDTWLAMFKMDGLTCSLIYENGKLVRAETRGDGEVGEDILHNMSAIKNVPQTIATDETIVVDGEIIITKSEFEKIQGDYKNPRNYASGSIRLLNSEECNQRNLMFVAWDLVKGYEDVDFFAWRLEILDGLGFTTVPRVGDAETIEDAISFLNEMYKRDDLDWKEYPIDGYVFKFESKRYGESLGKTGHHFKNAIAYKFYDETYPTKLVNIQWSMGRTGVLTPVAIFDPIEIDGTVVEKASLHNVSVMEKTLGEYPYIGEPLHIFKANMIIPQIAEAGPKVTEKEAEAQKLFPADFAPCKCPVCGGEVEYTSSADCINLECVNPACSGKLINRIDHFFGKKGLDAKGLSKKTIEKLIDWGYVEQLPDVFNLEKVAGEWAQYPGFGLKSVLKITDAIRESRTTDLATFITALGIPLVGNTVSKLIAQNCEDWLQFIKKVKEGFHWSEIEGIGWTIEYEINKYDYTEAKYIVDNYITWKQKEEKENNQEKTAENLTFVITGKLVSFKNREQLISVIENLGGKVSGSVSKKTSYLINNDTNSDTAKNKTAKSLGIPIISEQEFREKFL